LGVQNPFFKKGFGRRRHTLYKTGDIVRWLSDGNIEFLERIDSQVKIRGYRIEPGEIRGILIKQPGVKDVIVTLMQDKAGEKHLCAYIVPLEVDIEFLKNVLVSRLPGYMIPSFFIPIEKIPLNFNGKIDMKALPRPEAGEGGVKGDYVAPRDEVEKSLVSIWSEVLGIEERKISIDADFFVLGGHSLKVAIMVGKIQKKFNIAISLADIFKIPTVRGISSLIDAISMVVDDEQVNDNEEMEEIIL
jgi:acyl carrier protein